MEVIIDEVEEAPPKQPLKKAMTSNFMPKSAKNQKSKVFFARERTAEEDESYDRTLMGSFDVSNQDKQFQFNGNGGMNITNPQVVTVNNYTIHIDQGSMAGQRVGGVTIRDKGSIASTTNFNQLLSMASGKPGLVKEQPKKKEHELHCEIVDAKDMDQFVERTYSVSNLGKASYQE